MDNNRFLHCDYLCTDTVPNMNDVRRLKDGRLFTVGQIGKMNQGGKYGSSPSGQFLFGRVSEDEGKSWSFSFIRQLPETTALTIVGDFLIDRDGRIHIFFLHIYSMDPGFRDSKAYHGDITYARLDDADGNGMIYKKIDALDRYTGSMNCVLQLASGRIIAPFSTISHAAGSAFVSSVVYSDDGGDTWLASNDVSVVSNESNIESGAVEPIVVEAKDGVLVMIIRTVLNCFYYSVSYDEGATWTQAKPTRIPSSNAPGGVLRMEDGRIVLTWNDVLGHPMHGVRYSFARQCLHAAMSDDGMKTLKGARIIMRKRADDPDNLLNCYPFVTSASTKEVFVRPFSVQDREGTMWVQPQAHLIRLNPDDLTAEEMENSFGEWITDCEVTENGILMKPTVSGVAYACVNFPYASEGTIRLTTGGALPEGTRILLADSYLDRATFLPENRNGGYAEYLKDIYASLAPEAAGEWTITWNKDSLTLTSGEKSRTVSLDKWGRGFNHLSVLFEGEDAELNITGFSMRGTGGMETGIEY
ncbi:MAG: exo-alpha-sialidase [Clostridia bacterium]|nr:exo-alpha-sialidase [Clostridia bacterium]